MTTIMMEFAIYTFTSDERTDGTELLRFEAQESGLDTV